MTIMATDFEPYILNETNMLNYLKYKINNNANCTVNETIKINNNNNEKMKIKNNNGITNPFLFIPKEQDSLFWCYYIILNGDVKYEMLPNKNSLLAKQIKIDYINKIRENKTTIKSYKFDTISNIENNLANDNLINIKTIMTLCVIEKINIIFISKKTYYELLMNDDKPIYVIREVESKNNYLNYVKKYGFEMANQTILEEIRSSLYRLDNLDKPIKGLSSYKVPELIEICNKLAIETINKETGKNKTKNDLYEAIIQYF